MATFCCAGNRDCIGVSAAISVILGVIAAFLRITGVIIETPAFLWVTFGVAVGLLAILLVSSGCCPQISAYRRGRALTAVLIGILITILVSVVLLAISFAATGIVGAILLGLLILAFSLALTATACLIRCLAEND